MVSSHRRMNMIGSLVLSDGLAISDDVAILNVFSGFYKLLWSSSSHASFVDISLAFHVSTIDDTCVSDLDLLSVKTGLGFLDYLGWALGNWLNSPCTTDEGTPGFSEFVANTCWFIWYARNLLVHEARQPVPSTLVTKILAFTWALAPCSQSDDPSIRSISLRKWILPVPNLLKLNCDASLANSAGGTEFIIQSSSGSCLGGGSAFFLEDSILVLEVLAIRECLIFAV
ncbi:hypothetical protein Cni_G16519 [Canna indica]|uniref:Uncharacterized protein n=1 Tax=Canna indica TaxID=4628 RepID=A0AAQ3QFQ8_9LILI|nr:hypothetical protein Cni_G16519 [Canna indica]